MENRFSILIVYYSFSNQTHRMISACEDALYELGISFKKLRLRPETTISFPLNSIKETVYLMIKTLFRWRIPVDPIPEELLSERFDLIILAGPTWSYNPSAPVLSFIDRYGNALFKDTKVLPLISCRSYWKNHFNYLRRQIKRSGGEALNPIVLTHPEKEPWKTIGVFLTISGANPKRIPLVKKRVTHYGHDRAQLERLKTDIIKKIKSIIEHADMELTK